MRDSELLFRSSQAASSRRKEYRTKHFVGYFFSGVLQRRRQFLRRQRRPLRIGEPFRFGGAPVFADFLCVDAEIDEGNERRTESGVELEYHLVRKVCDLLPPSFASDGDDQPFLYQ